MFDATKVIQVGLAVENVDECIKFYTEKLGLGPFWITELDVPKAYYRGEYKGQKMKIAMCKLGPVALELIEKVDGYSIHDDFVKEHGEGVDHIAVRTSDLKADLEELMAKGFKYIEGDPDAGFAYIDCDKVGGMKIELIQMPEGVSMNDMVDQGLAAQEQDK